jgi:hypothetical protein
VLTIGATIAGVCAALTGLGIGAGLFMMGRGVSLALTERRLDVVEQLEATLGLTPDGRDGAVGVVDGVPVAVVRSGSGFTLTASVGPGAQRLTIRLRPVFSGATEALGEVGFDERVRVAGEPPEVLRARMDRKTRLVVYRAVTGGAVLARGEWRAEVDLVSALLVDGLQQRLRILIDAARAIDATTGPVEQRLEAIAAEDPRFDLRYRALTARIAMGPVDTAWLRERIRANVAEEGAGSDWRVVVVAAQLLGEEGEPELVRVLDTPDRDARRAAAIALAAVGPGDAQDRVEAELVQNLDRPHKALLDALGRVGTPRSIPALRVVVGRLTDRRRTRARLLAAIAAIQARSGGPPGALGLADEAEVGGLSLADEAAEGMLALSRNDDA